MVRVVGRPARNGTATVEFAVVAPVFLIMVLGMIEIGRGVSVMHSLENAARSGCRSAIVQGATQDQISGRVATALAGTGIADFSVSVQPSPLSSAEQGDAISVEVSVRYNDVSLVPVPKFLGGATLTGTCSLPRE